MITPEPIEAFYFGIWTILITHPPIQIGFIEWIISFQNRIIVNHLLRTTSTMRKLPGIFIGIFISLEMFNIEASFKHQYFQSFFGKFLSGPTATDTGANNNGIVSILGHR